MADNLGNLAVGERRMKEESPFACDMNAIAPEQRGAHLAVIERLFQSVESIRELSNGYKFQLSNESEVLLEAAEFIARERLCCPFLDFGLEVEREGGAVYLSLTGREGVKPFILAEIGGHLPSELSVSIEPTLHNAAVGLLLVEQLPA